MATIIDWICTCIVTKNICSNHFSFALEHTFVSVLIFWVVVDTSITSWYVHTTFYKRLASMISEKRNTEHSQTVNWICCKLIEFCSAKSLDRINQRGKVVKTPSSM